MSYIRRVKGLFVLSAARRIEHVGDLGGAFQWGEQEASPQTPPEQLNS